LPASQGTLYVPFGILSSHEKPSRVRCAYLSAFNATHSVPYAPLFKLPAHPLTLDDRASILTNILRHPEG